MSSSVERTRNEIKEDEEESAISDDATTIVHEARLEIAPPRQLGGEYGVWILNS